MVQQIDAPLREDVRLLGNLLGETLNSMQDKNCLIRSSKSVLLPKVHVMVKLKPKSN